MKKSVWKWYGMAMLLLTSALHLETAFAAEDRSEDIQKYIAIFSTSTDRVELIRAAEKLAIEGLSDPQLFDVVEKKLLGSYKSAKERSDIELAAWLAKGLSFSGQEKYRATLQQVAKGTRTMGVVRHAEASMDRLSQYAKWNPIINDQSQPLAGKSGEINRLANMIRSNDKELQEVAARYIIVQSIRDTDLLTIVQQTVTPDLSKSWSSKEDIDGVAFMLKALALSGKPQFVATVQEAANNAFTYKVKTYAKGYLKNT